MNFVISRVRGSNATPPVDGAVRFDYVYDNHKFAENRIGWTIKVDSLEELADLMRGVEHPLIIGPWYADKSRIEITIYDGYVE